MAIVEIIKPTKTMCNASANTSVSKRRVCAYARVSTDSDDQLNSYKVQIEEFTRKINSNPNWEFKGMYADEGISGTQAKKRPEFMKMIMDAMDGEIDLILTKSISRFGRNTAEIINYVRELREINVEIFFEKENLSSLDTKTDFVLSILASISQEESRSISTNVKWSVEKRFKRGITPTPKILGLDSVNKKYVINEQEAPIIREIFNKFLHGYNINDIVASLNERGITTVKGNKWFYASVRAILTQEKYCGNALLQKTVTVDYLSHKIVKNNGIAPMYLVKGSHDAIVSVEDFEKVQELLKYQNTPFRNKKVTKHLLTALVYCPICKRSMKRNAIAYGRPSEKIILDCNHSYQNKIKCHSSSPRYDLVEGACESARGELISKGIIEKDKNIRDIFSIIIADSINCVLVVSTKRTSDLICSIDELWKMNPTFSSVYVDDKLNQGIYYKVVILHE
jgi:DNA invertase Pin-like site-specific DNA recombinase